MKIKNAYFLKSCVSVSQFPSYPYPEFAFLGRSNVGKSSLLNMILGQKDLVKTGSRPGVTRAINFFIANDNSSFVDLPGFGYAKVPANIRKKFMPLIKSYLEGRENLKVAFLLIDIRRTPGDFEEEMLAFLEKNRIPVVITLTKCDKLSGNLKKKRINEIMEAMDIDRDSLFLTSCKTGEGKREILSVVGDFLKNDSPIVES
jgi:GTP-binding protein